MNSLYLYNKGTNKLHIQGYCQYTGKGGGLQIFKSEDEVLSATGQPFVMCKVCQKKRDAFLAKNEASSLTVL